MAKKYIIYASGKDLALVPVTQNEVGKYYRNSAGTYFKPILSLFDTATLPTGYKTYIGGSHAKYVSNANRNPIDFSIVAGSVLSMNVDVNVLATNPSDGSWCKITPVGSDYVIALVHTYQWAKGLVKAGSPICKIAPQSVTGFAPHLHLDEWSNRGLRIRKLILDGDFNMDTFKVGDRIEFTDVQNIRSGSGTSYSTTSQTAKGMTATIIGGSRVANGYTWWDIRVDNGGTGWVAMVDKFKIYTPPIIIPPDPTVELNKQIEALKLEIEGLKEALGTSQNSLRISQERVKFLEDEKKTWEEEIKKLEKEVLDVQDEAKEWKRQYTEVVTELNELKASHWTKKLRDEIVALWNKYKDAILKLIKGQ